MSIAHELSSDVAAAVLAPRNDGRRPDATALAQVVLEVHTTLRRLTAEGRRRARGPSRAADSPAAGDAAAAG